MSKFCLGIDFGGTTIKFGLLGEDMAPAEALFDIPTPVSDGADAIVDVMVRGCRRVVTECGFAMEDVLGVGIGSPGPLSISRGILLNLPNVPGMQNFPLSARVSEILNLPVTLENDANAAAYGEYICGAGKGTRDLIMLTLGTGVGGGIICHDEIIHGRYDMGGELGHLILEPNGRECSCGQKGCLEQYCSASNIAKHATAMIHEKKLTGPLADVLREKGTINTRDINLTRCEGDPVAAEIWDQCTRYLALGCVNLCRIFDPDRILFAGGLSMAGDDLLEPTQKHFQELNWTLLDTTTELMIAALGTHAGVMGAAGVAWKIFK
jgi:glucokinase